MGCVLYFAVTSNAHNMCVLSLVQFFSELSDYRLPTFPNLTHLRLGGRNGGWNLKLLNEFLECSPNLQVLTLEVC